jgi:hypothetical protein
VAGEAFGLMGKLTRFPAVWDTKRGVHFQALNFMSCNEALLPTKAYAESYLKFIRCHLNDFTPRPTPIPS